jgi:hypothetical protein
MTAAAASGCSRHCPTTPAPCDCASPCPSEPATVRPASTLEPKCEFGTSDPTAESETLFYLTVRGLPTAGKVRVQGLITIQLEAMFIRDIHTGKTYWLDLTRQDFAGLLPCDGYFGVIEGRFDPKLVVSRYGHRNGGLREVSYAHGICHLDAL